MSEAPVTTEPAAPRPPTYQVLAFVDTAQLKRDLSYSPTNLTDAMMQQASMFAHYGILAAQASRQVDTVKMLLENTEAAVYRLRRDAAVAANEKQTEAQLSAQVTRHPKVIEMKRALNEAKQQEAVAKTAMEAFRHRRDMLIQEGLLQREEMKGELSIMERSARDQALEAQKERFKARQNGGVDE